MDTNINKFKEFINTENEVFKILTNVRNNEIGRLDAMDQILGLFDFSKRDAKLVCTNCGSHNIDKHGGDGIYCLDCHKEL